VGRLSGLDHPAHDELGYAIQNRGVCHRRVSSSQG